MEIKEENLLADLQFLTSRIAGDEATVAYIKQQLNYIKTPAPEFGSGTNTPEAPVIPPVEPPVGE